MVFLLLAATLLDPALTPKGEPRYEPRRRVGDAGVVTGLVTDDDGRPLAGATVVFVDGGSTRTGDAGTFAFTVPAGASLGGDRDVAAKQPGYLEIAGGLPDVSTPRHLVFRLPKPVPITVTFDGGQLVTKVIVSMEDRVPRSRWWMRPFYGQYPVDGGVASIDNLPPGDYRLWLQGGEVSLRVSAAQPRVFVSTTGRLEVSSEGRTTWRTGDRFYVNGPTTFTDAIEGRDGGMVLEGLLPGTYWLRKNSTCQQREVVVGPGTTRVHFDAGEWWSISGRVLEANGKPSTGRVRVDATQLGGEAMCALSADVEDGGFTVELLPTSWSGAVLDLRREGVGDKRLWLGFGGPRHYGPSWVHTTVSRDAGFVTLAFPRQVAPRLFTGVVTSPDGGPLAGVTVRSSGLPRALHLDTKTNQKGAFTSRSPFEQPVSLTFELDGFQKVTLAQTEVKRVVLRPEVLTVRLPLPGIHDIFVRHRDGTPLRQCTTAGVAYCEWPIAGYGDYDLDVVADLNDGRTLMKHLDAGTLDVVLE